MGRRASFDPYTPVSPGQYGGVSSVAEHWAPGGQNNVVAATPSAETTDVDRFRDIGDQMQKRDPYKFDWSQTSQDHANELDARGSQNDAAQKWLGQADGSDNTSYNYGQSLLKQGAQNQQAGALSASGGPLAQVGAARNVANANSAYMQNGTAAIDAQKADDMAAGRAGYASALASQRSGDVAAQGLSDQQAALQASAAAQQRKLNDAGQYGMEKMGVDVEGQAVQARQHEAADVDKGRANMTAADDASDARAMNIVNSGIGMVPVVGKGLAGAGSSAQAATQQDGGSGNDDPYSDERTKDIQSPNALISVMKGDGKSQEEPAYDHSVFQSHGRDDGGDIGTEALHQGIEKQISRDEALEQARQDMAADMRAKRVGVSGAPRGYARRRAGKPGSMFFGGNSPGSTSSAWDSDHHVAPGTRDVLKYGTPSKRSEEGQDDYSKAISLSDERAKNKAETPEEKKAREDKEDAEETAKFMKDTPKDAVTYKAPVGYEERSKAIDERDAQDKQIAEEDKRAAQAPALAWIEKQDRARREKGERLRFVPLLGKWVAAKHDANEAQTDDQKVARAVEEKKREDEILAFKKRQSLAADKYIPESVRIANAQAPVSFGYRWEHDERQPGAVRQLTSFTRTDPKTGETMSDERTKSKTALDVVPLRDEEDGRGEMHEDGDFKPSSAQSSSQGASLSGPTPTYSKPVAKPAAKPSAARPAPGAVKKKAFDPAEFDRLFGGMEAQHKAQLGAGPSVSDERAKNKGYGADKGAGGGESESGGTTEEHRGPALTEDPAAHRQSNPLIEMQKHANRQLRGETYTYKDGVGEDPNRMHHGFMAQNLETNPITATAVREGHDGLKRVDNEDVMRVTAAGVASLQDQHDELEEAVAALSARRGKKRVA